MELFVFGDSELVVLTFHPGLTSTKNIKPAKNQHFNIVDWNGVFTIQRTQLCVDHVGLEVKHYDKSCSLEHSPHSV